MSAVPKKKLCWNCEGNVSKELDNCPYCKVYLHAIDSEEDSQWNPSYHAPKLTEEIPSPLYQISVEQNLEDQEDQVNASPHAVPFHLNFPLEQLKRDVFPTLFLMMGSLFFLFGVVLILFSQNGTLTLQWQGHYGFYYLLLAFPLIVFGWKFLQQLEENE